MNKEKLIKLIDEYTNVIDEENTKLVCNGASYMVPFVTNRTNAYLKLLKELQYEFNIQENLARISGS